MGTASGYKPYKKHINKVNPLGMSGAIAETYGALLEDMWSGKFTCVAPRHFKVHHKSTSLYTIHMTSQVYFTVYHTYGQSSLLHCIPYIWQVKSTSLYAIHMTSQVYFTVYHTYGQSSLLHCMPYIWPVKSTSLYTIHMARQVYFTVCHTYGQSSLLQCIPYICVYVHVSQLADSSGSLCPPVRGLCPA